MEDVLGFAATFWDAAPWVRLPSPTRRAQSAPSAEPELTSHATQRNPACA